MLQIFEMFLEEQKLTFGSLADQTRNLAQTTDAIKTDVLHVFSQLQEQKGNCSKSL